MIKEYLDKITARTYLLLILLLAAMLRFYGLGTQSFWLDELGTVNEANPDWPMSELFRFLKCCDQHPPLIYLLERAVFSVFGTSECTARIGPAIAGVAAVYVMYLLGKRLKDERLGLFTAAITCVNFYAVTYAQEARDYILLFLFTGLSYLYFIRLYRELSARAAAGWVISSVLLLYSHYFSLFVIASQLVLLVLLWLKESERRKDLFKWFFVSYLIVLIAYLPWFSFLLEMESLHDFWIPKVPPFFFATYFSEYFGHNLPVVIVAVSMVIWFLFSAVKAREDGAERNKLAFACTFFMVTVVVSYMLPYLRSLMAIPMMVSRHTIIVLPSFLIAVAYGITLVKPLWLRTTVLLLVMIGSLADLVWVKDYYSKPSKTQFREMAALIRQQGNDIPMIDALTAWHFDWYLKKNEYRGTVFKGTKEAEVDSILRKSSSRYDIPAFWMVMAHTDKPLDALTRKNLDTAYDCMTDTSFFNCRIQLFVVKGKGNPDPDKEIREVLSRQENAWNEGNIPEYMKGYWNNDSLLFIGKSGPQYGYNTTLQRYLKAYPDKSHMGKLTFTLFKLQPLAPDCYLVGGHWSLKREAGDIGGVFTLIFRRIGGKWVIVCDHTS